MRAVVKERRVEPGAVNLPARFSTVGSTCLLPSIKMAVMTSMSAADMRDGLYHRIWSSGAEME